MIKILLIGLSLISTNVFAATVDGSLIVGGTYKANGNNLSDVTYTALGTVWANGATGDILPTVNIFTPAGTGGSLNLDVFAPVTNFFTVGGWQLDLSTLNVVDQEPGVLNLAGAGLLTGYGFDATDVNWSFSSSSLTSYSMTVSSVSPVPVPAAAWLFGSGILGLAGIARRKI